MMKICVYQTLCSQDGTNYQLSEENKQFKTWNLLNANMVIATWNRQGEIGDLPKWKYIIVEIRDAILTEIKDDTIPLMNEGCC